MAVSWMGGGVVAESLSSGVGRALQREPGENLGRITDGHQAGATARGRQGQQDIRRRICGQAPYLI